MSKTNSMNDITNRYSKYILDNQESFNLKHIFECGQCFRWNYDNENDRYIGIVLNHVITVKEEQGKYVFTSTIKTDKELENFVYKYFNLSLNYNDVKKELINKNSINILNQDKKEDDRLLKHNISLKEAIDYGYGIRILKQELWETVVSYIISTNNNIPRIKKIIEKIAKEYGNPISFEDKTYYSFPIPKELSRATIENLRDCGLGYRDKSVFNITKAFLESDSLGLKFNEKTLDIKNKLVQYKGIGPKVADCILLFSLNKYEVFPIDVWVRRVINSIYFNKQDEKQVTNNEIIDFANKKYDKYAGIAQQYLFYWKRETN